MTYLTTIIPLCNTMAMHCNVIKYSALDSCLTIFLRWLIFSCKRDKHICKQPTILTKDERYQANLGQRVEISFLDGYLMNQLYCKCKGVSIKCQNGGYPHPKDCSICKCPDGFGGSYCENVQISHSSQCHDLYC